MADQENFQDIIHVRVGQTRANSTRFKIKQYMPLKKLFNEYIKLRKIKLNFQFRKENGQILKGSDTPASLGMIEDEFIEAFIHEDLEERIKVRLCLELDSWTRYKLKRHFPLKRIFKQYAERMGLEYSALIFYDENGNRMYDTATPASLALPDNTLIRAIIKPPCHNLIDDESLEETIHVKVGEDRQNAIRFKIKRFMPLQKMFNAYAEVMKLQLHELRFFNDDGERLHGTDTPASLEMEEDAFIDVITRSDGGSI